MPLEQVARPQRVLSGSIELHISLNGLERIARVKLSNNFRVIDAAHLGRPLLEHLPYRESLSYVGADASGIAAILRQVVTDHLGVLVGVDRGIPTAVRHEHAFRLVDSSNGIGKHCALVGSCRRNDGLRVEVLLLESLDICNDIIQQRTGNDDIRL